jgi:hypothetical protein
MTDTSQIQVDIRGPLDRFAYDAAAEIAKANAIQYRAREQGSMTSSDPALMRPLINDYARIAARWSGICKTGHAKVPADGARLEARGWETGLRYCDLEVKLWTNVATLLRAALDGVPLTADERADGDATYRAAEASATRFLDAYQAYVHERG